jgi:septal ring factor EnvC (AmiA/AmiB activator)
MAELAESTVNRRESSRRDEIPAYLGCDPTVSFVSEALRASQTPASANNKNEEKVSFFWRVFGGSLVSVFALVLLQAYQSLTGNIHELRSDQNRMREAAADFIKKDELSNRTTQLWNRLQELQNVSAQLSLTANKLGVVEQQLTTAESERKELVKELTALRERLAKLEGAQQPPAKTKTD